MYMYVCPSFQNVTELLFHSATLDLGDFTSHT